jgi:hypothetical protein
VLRLGKLLIGVSNPDRYDLHQNDLLGELERGGYLLWCRDLAALGGDIERIGDMQFRRYDEPPCSIHHAITAFLQGGDMTRWTKAAENTKGDHNAYSTC